MLRFRRRELRFVEVLSSVPAPSAFPFVRGLSAAVRETGLSGSRSPAFIPSEGCGRLSRRDRWRRGPCRLCLRAEGEGFRKGTAISVYFVLLEEVPRPVPRKGGLGTVKRKSKQVMNSVLECLRTRRSVRGYDPDRMPAEELIAQVVEAGMYAPTGRGMQSPRMAVVTDRVVRDRLAALNAAVMGSASDPFYGAPAVVVVLADRTRPTYLYDGTLVMGNLLNAAHALGLGHVGFIGPGRCSIRRRAKPSWRPGASRAITRESVIACWGILCPEPWRSSGPAKRITPCGSGRRTEGMGGRRRSDRRERARRYVLRTGRFAAACTIFAGQN